MNMWTNDMVRAEADYRRAQLHRMASHRRQEGEGRSGAWRRWLPRGRGR
jgi:hypothetical protein